MHHPICPSMRFIHHRALPFWALLLGVATTTLAQKSSGSPQLDTAQSQDLDEVVVAGSRWSQAMNHVPSQVDVVSKKNIAQFQPQTAADLLGLSGKVFIQKSQQGGGSPMIRGFATNRLIYTVDGVRMNTAIFRSGNIQNVINLDPFATERAEVVFGPASVVYGSDAVGGVMAFSTLQPHFGSAVRGNVDFRFTSANKEQTAHADVSYGGKRWAAVTSLSRWDFDHLRQGSRGPSDYVKPYYVLPGLEGDSVVLQRDSLLQIPTAYRQWNFMQKVVFRPSAQWKIEYALHHSQTSAYGRYDRHNRIRNGLPRYAEWDYGPQLWTMNLLSAQHLKKTRWYDQASYRAAVQTFAESRIDRSLNKPDRTVQSEYVTAYSFNADYTRALGNRHRIFYGLEGVLDDVRSAGEVVHLDTDLSEPTFSRYPQATWHSVGLYASDEWNASPKTTVTSGLRLNAVGLDADFTSQLAYFPLPFASAQVRDEALTGSFGVAHRPNARWTFKANAGTAFRAPNVDDMGKIFDSSPGMVVVPNDQLKSEYAYNADVDIAWKSSAGVKVDFAAYATLLEGALVRRPTTLNGEDSILYDGELSRVESIQNAAVARVAGVHLAAEVPLAPAWLAYASVNVQNGTEVMDDGTVSAARHAAPVFGTSRLTYRKNRLRADAYVNFQGARAHDRLAVEEQAKTEIYAKDANGQTYCPAWYTANVRATYTTKFGLRAQVGLENLTDVRYRPYSSGVSGAGRSVVVAVHVQF